MMVGLTVLLIVTLMVLVISKPESRGVLIGFSGVIIVIALIGVYITHQQVSRVKARIKRLPESYQAVYLSAHELVGTYGMLKGDKQEIMGMILEIFEHASIDGRHVDEVIDHDLAVFVDGFITEKGKRHTAWYLLSYATSLFIGYLLLMKAYKVIRTGDISMEMVQSETLDVGLVATYGLVAYIFFPWLLLIIQRSTKYQWRGIKRIQILIPFVVPLGVMMSLMLINNPEFIKVVDQPVPLFTNLWTIGIGVLLFMGSLWMIRIQQKRH